jgi:hypothetical protein
MKNMSKKEGISVFYTCDKRNCGKYNYRTLGKKETIVTDICTHCGQLIHEPVWQVFEPEKNWPPQGPLEC